MLHYHGTPITPRTELLKLSGRHFCVSFADPRDVAVCHEIGQSVMLDNGAFSMWRAGKPTDWPGFYDWCDRWLDYPTTWAVIPDVIDGDEADNDRLITEWPFGDRGVPVWHMHESLERLYRLAERWSRLCIGSSAEYQVVGSKKWHGRMRAAWDLLCPDGGRPPWVHMLRGLALCGSLYPFASADSTNIARNHASTKEDILDMVQRIDAVQCPGRWDSPRAHWDPFATQVRS
jgi:hypothetical protein